MKLCHLAFVALLCSFTMAAVQAAPEVLRVISSEGRDAGKTRPGFERDEFAKAWLPLRANGLEVEVASPAGGAPEADRHDPADDHHQRLRVDPQAATALQNTRRTQDLRAGEHAALFVIGGKGAMFDLPRDPALKRLLMAGYDGGGVLAWVCHGPAAPVPLRRADGTALVAGRQMTGFTDEEEASFGKRWAAEFPFALVERWLAGERQLVRAVLRDGAQDYKPDLIAMLGDYQSKAAGMTQPHQALTRRGLAAP